jgi:hypothetical protein
MEGKFSFNFEELFGFEENFFVIFVKGWEFELNISYLKLFVEQIDVSIR